MESTISSTLHESLLTIFLLLSIKSQVFRNVRGGPQNSQVNVQNPILKFCLFGLLNQAQKFCEHLQKICHVILKTWKSDIFMKQGNQQKFLIIHGDYPKFHHQGWGE